MTTLEITTTHRGYLELLKITKDLSYFSTETVKTEGKKRILLCRIYGNNIADFTAFVLANLLNQAEI